MAWASFMSIANRIQLLFGYDQLLPKGLPSLFTVLAQMQQLLLRKVIKCFWDDEKERGGKANNTKKYYWNMAWSSFQSTEAHNFAMQKLQSVAREVPIQRIPDGTRKLISCASQPLNSTSRVKKKGDSQLLSGRITIICWCKNVTGAAMAIATIYKLHSEVFQLR